MIDGVNLITTETICVSGSFVSNLIPAVLSAIACIGAIVVVAFCVKEKEWGAFFFSLAIGIVMFFISLMCFKEAFNPKYEERYLVQLDDKISSGFIDKYEVVERKGNNVYVIRERDIDD